MKFGIDLSHHNKIYDYEKPTAYDALKILQKVVGLV